MTADVDASQRTDHGVETGREDDDVVLGVDAMGAFEQVIAIS